MERASGLDLVVVGPGRAGGSIALAAADAGHRIVGVLSRSGDQSYGPALSWEEPLPETDLMLVAVKDEAIPEVVDRLEGSVASVGVAAHLSGFVPVEVLAPFRSQGVAVGGLHPLQTLPEPDTGRHALAGAFAGVGGDPDAHEVLRRLADSLGMIPFDLPDRARPAYHAASAASSNFVVTALGVARELFSHAAIDPAVARQLVDQVVANTFEYGADAALTGPIARGDTDTVRGHLVAAGEVSEEVGRQFRLLAEATAIQAGRGEDVNQWK